MKSRIQDRYDDYISFIHCSAEERESGSGGDYDAWEEYYYLSQYFGNLEKPP